MKTKYAAHLIMAIKYKKLRQETFPFYENVVLVYADSDEEAMRKACELGHAQLEIEEDDFRWDGHPARWEFMGVRKLITCESMGFSDRLRTGTELTYSQMWVRTEADLRKLADGESVEVTYEE